MRRGTSAQWTAANPVLGEGEFGFETDTVKLKIGDGISGWVGLSYISLDWGTLAGKPVVIAAGATEADARAAIGAEDAAAKGQPSGYASLDVDGLVPQEQLPITTADWDTLEGKPAVVAAGATKADARAVIDAEDVTARGQPSGYASLDADGTVPFAQIPDGVAVDGVTRTDGYLQFLSGSTPVGDPVLLDWDVIDGGSATSVSATTLDGGTPT